MGLRLMPFIHSSAFFRCLSVAAAATALLAAGASSAAAGPFPSGKFSSEKGCPSTDIHSKGEPTLIDAKSLEAIEYYCEFVGVRSALDGKAWLIDAVCNEPGFVFPQQMVALEEESDGQGPTVLRLSEGAAPAQEEEGRYYRCAGGK